MSIDLAAAALVLLSLPGPIAGPAEPQGEQQTQEPVAKSLDDARKAASEAYARGDWGTAAALFRRVVDVAAADQMAWFGLGLAENARSQLDEAATAFRKAADLGADMGAFARFQLACVLACHGNKDAAILELGRGLDDATPGTRGELAKTTRAEPRLDSLRGDPRFAGILSKILDPTIASPARDAAYTLLRSAGGMPADAGLLPDGRILLYFDRSNYRKPGTPLLATDESGAFLLNQSPTSLEDARTSCSKTLPLFPGAQAVWSKARLYSELLHCPVGAVMGDKLFVYFYQSNRAAFIDQRVISIIDLLLKQSAKGDAIPYSKLRLDITSLLKELENTAQPVAAVRAQFDILFGYDPFVPVVSAASDALHGKWLVKDPRDSFTREQDEFQRRPFYNGLFRCGPSLAPGVVSTSWPSQMDAPTLHMIEETTRAILADMRETEAVFVSIFGGLQIPDLAASIPEESAAFWKFFAAKDWTWWQQPRLVALAQGADVASAFQDLFHIQEQTSIATEDFGGAWKAYFDNLNNGFRSRVSYTMQGIATEQIAAVEETKFIEKHPGRRDALLEFARARASIEVALDLHRKRLGGREEALDLLCKHEVWMGSWLSRSQVIVSERPIPFGLRFSRDGGCLVSYGDGTWTACQALPDPPACLDVTLFSGSLSLCLTEVDGEEALQAIDRRDGDTRLITLKPGSLGKAERKQPDR